MIRVVVYSDEPLVWSGLQQLLEPQPDIQLIGIASEVEDLIRRCVETQPDVVLLSNGAVDDRMVLTTLRWESPRTAAVLWVNEIAPELAHQAMESGARGILRRNLSTEMLLKCIRKVYAGEMWFDKSLANTFLSGRAIRLSRRESQMIALLAEGQKNKEIATTLNISEGTVKVYLSRLFSKVGAKDRYELALFGLRNSRNPHAQAPGLPAVGLRSLFINSAEPPHKRNTRDLIHAAPASRTVS